MNPELFGCPIPKTGDPYEDARAPLLWMLSELQKQYQEAARPYIARLAEIEACRPRHYVIGDQMLELINSMPPAQKEGDQ